MSRLRNLIFPLILAMILGGLAAWLERVSELPQQNSTLNPNEPQYQINGMQGRRFDLSGSLQQELHADRAWQMPGQKDVFLQQPVLHTFEQGQAQYQVRSSSARYHTDSRKLFFEHEVILDKHGNADTPPAKVQTTALTVDTAAQTAQTDAAVSYEYGQSHGTAQGLQYDHRSGVLNLPSQVKALIYDPKQHP